MIFGGRVFKRGKFWIAECDSLDASTQGFSKKEAIEMLADWIETAANNKSLLVRVGEGPKNSLIIETNENAAIIALILQRERQKHGLSVRDVARLLGMKSHTAYAQYERGKTEPSLTQMERFLSAIAPEKRVQFKIG